MGHLGWILGKKSLVKGLLSVGRDCSGKWLHHDVWGPWRHGIVVNLAVLGSSLDLMILNIFSNLNDSTKALIFPPMSSTLCLLTLFTKIFRLLKQEEYIIKN